MPKQLEPVSLNVDMPTIMAYADLTDDYNPIHVDREFAEKTEMKGIIAHGTMSLNMIWRSLRQTLGNDAIAGTRIDIRFVRPVRENDIVTGGGVEREDAPGTYDVWVRNQKDEPVIAGTATVSQ